MGIVSLSVQILMDHVTALNGYGVFTGVTAHDNGNVFFHQLVEYRDAKVKKKALAFLYLST
jgi:hypothetical protein